MVRNPLGTALQRLPADSRIVSATVLVSTVAVLGRFFGPSLDVVLAAGLLGGFVNGLRTGEWEFGTVYGALPGLLSAVVLTLALVVAVPIGHYEFPIGVGEAFSIIGPILELQVFAVLYMVEGWVAFVVTRKVTGQNALDKLWSAAR